MLKVTNDLAGFSSFSIVQGDCKNLLICFASISGKMLHALVSKEAH